MPKWFTAPQRTNAIAHAVMERSCGCVAGMAFGNHQLRHIGLGPPASPPAMLPRILRAQNLT